MKHTRMIKLCLLMLFGMLCLCVNSNDVYAETYGDWEYQLTDDGQKVVITKYMGEQTDVVESLVVPSEIEGKPVVEIGEDAMWRTKADTVVLPESLEIIGTKAFYSSSFQKMVIPSNVKKIRTCAFWDCYKMKEIVIPGECIIEEKPDDVNLWIGQNPWEMYGVFLGCDQNDNKMTIKSSLGSLVYDYAKRYNLAFIPNGAAEGYYYDEQLVGYKYDSNDAYYEVLCCYDDEIEKISIPSQIDNIPVTKIGTGAFAGCNKITELVVNGKINGIGSDIFPSHSFLVKGLVGTVLQTYALGEGKQFESIGIMDGTVVEGGVVYKLMENNTAKVIAYSSTEITTLDIKSEIANEEGIYKVVAIENEAMKKNTYITRVVIEEGIESIGDKAFSECSNLKEVVVPESLSYIGEKAFGNGKDIVSLQPIESNWQNRIDFYKRSVLCNSDLAFEGKIGSYAFYYAWDNCVDFKSNGVAENTYYDEENGSVYELNDTNSAWSVKSYYEPQNVPDVMYVRGELEYKGSVLPVTTVESDAFISKMEGAVVLGEGITTIEEDAFRFSKLNITLPESVQSICDTKYINKITTKAGSYAHLYALDYNTNEKYKFISITLDGAVDGVLLDDYIAYAVDEENNTAYVLGSTALNRGTYTIKSTVNIKGKTYNVTKVGNAAFYYSSSVSAFVKMPDTIVEIGDYAFHGVVVYNLSSNVEYIGDYVFDGGLNSVELPQKIKHIGEYAFAYSNIVGELPNGLEEIGEYAFYNCYTLSFSRLPENLREIPAKAFYRCPRITNVELSDSIKCIGEDAFGSCSNLKITKWPSNLEEIGKNSFENCESLDIVDLPDSVLRIGSGAFLGCTSLKELHIPKTVKHLSNIVSDGSEVTIYGCVGSAAQRYALNNDIKFVSVDETENYYTDEKGIIYTLCEDGTCSVNSYDSKICHGDIIIPDSIQVEGRIYTVVSIEDCAFDGCEKRVAIPKSVVSIGDYALNTEYPNEYDIYENVTFIGRDAFGKYNLEYSDVHLNIYGNTYAIDYAEKNDINYQIIYFDENNIMYGLNSDKTANVKKYTNDVVIEELCIQKKIDSEFGEYTVTEIDDDCFKSQKIKKIVIPDSIVSIGNGAFQDTSLEKINIPRSVKKIGWWVFSGCKMEELFIPETVEEIGKLIYNEDLDFLLKVVENSVAHEYAVENNMRYELVDSSYNPDQPGPGGEEDPNQPDNPGENEDPDQPENPGGNEDPDQPETPGNNGSGENGDNSGTTTPPAGDNTNPPATGNQPSTPAPAAVGTKLTVAASSCEVSVVSSDATTPAVTYTGISNASAKTVRIPDTVVVDGITYQVTSIAPNAFKGNKKLKSVTVGKNVTTIGKNAFENCKNLSSVTLASPNLKSIGANAFKGNKNLKKITIKSTKLTKKSIGKNALKGTNKKLVIKVPKKQLKDYKKFFKDKGNKTVTVKK